MDTAVFEQRESEVRAYCRAFPTVFTSASGARQVDESGRSYIDFFAGAGVLNFGHNNPKMKRALIEFLESDGVVHSLDTYTTAKRDFLARFHDVILAPRGMDHRMQFTGPTGTNAVEAALKLARLVTGRREVVAFSHGFHGMTLGALAATANEAFRQWAGVPLRDVVRLPYETAPGGKNALADYAAALADPSSGVTAPAAFLVEAVQAEGGVNVASAEWLRAVQDLARQTGALFIVDDIQAGCGRTGSYFSFDGFGLDPDIITLAKGLGGYGTPIAMNLNKPEVDAHWSPGAHTGTFRGQGLSLVAGAVALDYFTDDTLMNAVAENGEAMRGRLAAIAAAHTDRDWEVRGRGMMQALDVGDGALAKDVQRACFDAGLLIGPCGSGGRVLKLIPPLTIPEGDLAEGLDILESAITEVAR
ncbi:2,4-diaminobutyrate 4-transaminase OS=Tsukamurella paurometabola (strain ATCC 8368 / DSM / CCUG 35730 / CIP 100753 / JCM 10117 / KCTC 9821 / NBRC 16120/ NCIMB 702349 / NCTC 13040) OX=521096 GN=Tpau_4113 PE=3 SV=1 [Tsukamurella paurometabola]|uniref:Diaminobutyrate--2-oxoglutarate transaminase n=1 Tax=Tsukamurella paurometabola (strain ATCC 8368 / DSM 20162 / CCUG 35730 / CIP 100753 / JCM 10117 / KCTC 9821 / NBRC 16120 / NCIMB 702349 / NCTC 13040) TaxID=521096 RepID=D5UNX3_TSUPD|nr:aspartate aminotransferase family protein [Tsukamurella paurometabola]ADG80682.1 2,4-diaminobutyrate 4-transaminase [Tsukamurella paurometabola DSM 20162]SUP40556.1 Diaminobutyrate--2-oxoglutarate transaminase [Tsukamurella paurometabola]